MFFSPLEQFNILSIIPLQTSMFDLTFTNSSLLTLIIFLFILGFFRLIAHNNGFMFLVPSRWQFILESIYTTISLMVVENLGKGGQKYFPFIITLFIFILTANMIGLVPYSFTITSHIVVTFGLGILVFAGINYIAIGTHKIKILSLFLPGGVGLGLAIFLVPIVLYRSNCTNVCRLRRDVSAFTRT